MTSHRQIRRLLVSVSIPRMREHPLRTSLTLLGLSLGVAVMVAVVLVNDSILRSAISTIDDVAGEADLQISGATSGVSETLIDVVRTTKGVYRSTPVMQQVAKVADATSRGERLLLLGVDMLGTEDEHFRQYGSGDFAQIKRDPLLFLNSAQNLILGRRYAEQMGYRRHDQIRLLTSNGVKTFDIWGFIDDTRVANAFGGAIAIMYYPAMQVAFGRGNNVDRIDVAIEPGVTLSEVEQALHARLGSAVVVATPAQKGAQLGQMIEQVRSALLMSSFISLLVGAFLIQNTMAISVLQRRREIGTLRALGATRGQILSLITLEGTLFGILGSALGVAAGAALSGLAIVDISRVMDESFFQLPVSHVQLDPIKMFGAWLAGVVAATLAAALPARRAAQTSPVESMRSGALAINHQQPARRVRTDALAVLGLALAWFSLRLPSSGSMPIGPLVSVACCQTSMVLLMPRIVGTIRWLGTAIAARWLPGAARLGAENLTRDPWRNSTSAAMLAICAGMTLSIGAFVSSFGHSVNTWIEHTKPGDLFVTSGTKMSGLSLKNAPLTPEFGRELATLPEVETVKPGRVVDLPFRGQTVKVLSTDIDAFARRANMEVLEGPSWETVRKRLKAGAIVVSENFARRFDVHPGERVALATRRGSTDFEVAGVVVEYSSDVGSITLNRAHYVEAWGDDRVDTFELDLVAGADAQAVRRTINERYGERYDLFVLTPREQRAEISRATDQLFGMMRGLELVAIIVAVLGVINTQTANILDRLREIGVLRAVGMRRRQTRGMLVVEAAMVAVCGALAGNLLGVAGGVIVLDHINLAQTGWHFAYQFPVRASLETSLSVVLASAIAGWLAGRRAAALPLTEALGYE